MSCCQDSRWLAGQSLGALRPETETDNFGDWQARRADVGPAAAGPAIIQPGSPSRRLHLEGNQANRRFEGYLIGRSKRSIEWPARRVPADVFKIWCDTDTMGAHTPR